MSLDVSVILFAAVLCSKPPSFLWLHHTLPTTSCKTCHQQTFSAWKKWPLLPTFFKAISFLSLPPWLQFWHLTQKIYLSLFFLLCFLLTKQSEFQRNKKPNTSAFLLIFFLFFLAETYARKQFPGKRRHESVNIFRHDSETNIKALLIGICYFFHIPFPRKKHWLYCLYCKNRCPQIQMNYFPNKGTVTIVIISLSWCFILKPNLNLSHSTHVHLSCEAINLNITGCPPSHFLSCTDIQSHDFLN